MRVDPEDKTYILLETDLEAHCAFEVGLITREPEYVKRMVEGRKTASPFSLDGPKPVVAMEEKLFIRAPRDIQKIAAVVMLIKEKEDRR